MITLSIDVLKIDKARLIQGEKGKYVDLVLIANKNGRNDRGNDGFVTQRSTKEEREQGIRMPIIGNWRDTERNQEQKPARPAARPQAKPPVQDTDEDDIPF